jgi:hypothetical protein
MDAAPVDAVINDVQQMCMQLVGSHHQALQDMVHLHFVVLFLCAVILVLLVYR